MRTIADLHIHSKYSRATSPQMEVGVLALWCRKKGIDVMATGDFTHPQYLKGLKEKLIEDGSGLLEIKSKEQGAKGKERLKSKEEREKKIKFILSGEISCIYKDKDKTRRQHVCLLVPDFETVDKINVALNKLNCNLKSDGRPIIGLSAKRLAQICFEANEKTLVIPAHIWTPWFSLFGSKSGYDSMEECYEELTPNIYAIETGLSSDPEMNWRLSALDNITILSNSDAHSPRNIGREANVFDLEKVDYNEIYEVIKNKDTKRFLYTVEFYPQEGRYHFDGHRKCNFVCSPQESKNKHKNICPVCKKELVLGVEHRVDDLADRKLGFRPENAVPFKSFVPLQEIVAECFQKGKLTKTVQTVFEEMLEKKTEFDILLDLNRKEIELISNEIIAEAIMRVRNGKVYTKPGYDGEYGVVKVFDEEEIKKLLPEQNKLF
ncbi:DNA helicase UvrD [Candidatus Kuenenbacteria bacterium]|nr:DNA helicase UvrD [Candidatus Kuenenbacteria bacterium]